MRGKLVLVVCALTLLSPGIASAKSYDITVNAPAMAGATELNPGAYKLKIEGSQAIYTDLKSGKSFGVPVKVESADENFSYTLLETVNQKGMNTHAIDLGGSSTRLTLGR